MNLYLRLIWTLLRSWRLKPMSAYDTLELQMRVLPNDLDINGHMNNGRYLTVVDLALVEFFVRTGLARLMLKRGWKPMSGGTVVSFRRGLQPFTAYTLKFSMAGCQGPWNFMRYEFWQNGKLCAVGVMKGASVSRQGLVEASVAYQALGVPMPAGALPREVQHWLAAEAALMAETPALAAA